MQILNAKPSCVVPTECLLKWRESFNGRKMFRDFLAFSKTLAELTGKRLTKSHAFFDWTPYDTYVCCTITLQLPFMMSAISSATWLPLTFIRKSNDKDVNKAKGKTRISHVIAASSLFQCDTCMMSCSWLHGFWSVVGVPFLTFYDGKATDMRLRITQKKEDYDGVNLNKIFIVKL